MNPFPPACVPNPPSLKQVHKWSYLGDNAIVLPLSFSQTLITEISHLQGEEIKLGCLCQLSYAMKDNDEQSEVGSFQLYSVGRSCRYELRNEVLGWARLHLFLRHLQHQTNYCKNTIIIYYIMHMMSTEQRYVVLEKHSITGSCQSYFRVEQADKPLWLSRSHSSRIFLTNSVHSFTDFDVWKALK